MENYLETLEKTLLTFDEEIKGLTIMLNAHNIYGETIENYVSMANLSSSKNNPLRFISQKEEKKCYELNQMISLSIKNNSLNIAASNLVALLSYFNPPDNELTHIQLLENTLAPFFTSSQSMYEIFYTKAVINTSEILHWNFQAREECTLDRKKHRIFNEPTMSDLMLAVLPQWQTMIEKDRLEQSVISNISTKQKLKL